MKPEPSASQKARAKLADEKKARLNGVEVSVRQLPKRTPEQKAKAKKAKAKLRAELARRARQRQKGRDKEVKKKGSGSVWTVSGGLPGLGKRR